MRRLARRALEAFPFEARSRRALDETLLDWEAEAGAALSRGWPIRAVVAMRSSLALLRALGSAGAREAIGLPMLVVTSRLAMFAFPMAALLVAEWVYLPDAVPYRYWPELYAARLVGPLELFLPLAAFLTAVTWRRAPLASLGYPIFALGAALLVVPLVPAAQWHGQSVGHHLQMFNGGLESAAPLAFIERGPLDALGALGSALLRRHDPAYWTSFAPVVLLAPLWAVAGGMVARSARGWRTALPVAATICYLVQVAFMSGLVARTRLAMTFPEMRVADMPVRTAVTTVMLWTVYLGVPVATLWLAHRARRAELHQTAREAAS